MQTAHSENTLPNLIVKRLIWLVPILLLAVVSRFWGINDQSLWIDEGFTWYLTQSPNPIFILTRDVHPPLYFLMFDSWVALTGDSVLAMRTFSLLASLKFFDDVPYLSSLFALQSGVRFNRHFPVS